MKKRFKNIVFTILLIYSSSIYSQNINPELNKLIETAFANNKELSSYYLQTKASKANIGTAFDFDKTTVYYGYDENNVAPNDKALRVFGIEQTFSFPTVYGARKKVYKSQWEQNKVLYEIQKNKLALAVSLVYDRIVYTQNKEVLYTQLDSLYSAFSKAGNRKFELGESNYLEKITAEAKSKQIHTTLIQLKNQKQALYGQLKSLAQSQEDFQVSDNQLEMLHIDGAATGKTLQKNYMETISKTYSSQLKLQNQSWLPDLSMELFTGTNRGLGYRQNGFQIGVAIPLLFSGNTSKRKTAKLEQQSWEAMRSDREIQMESFYMQKQAELNQHKEMINYYTENGQILSKEIIKTADMSYKNGEIDFFQYIQSLENAISIESDYLDSVLSYNQSYLELHYFNFNE
ncbi:MULTISPECIES: TolC family protein [Proteiniphilum]|uniref:TolC family protein n=1 Tax=Proteiniphilum TaxID=294702 RepID=UPI00092B7308|nr:MULTISPECIES: TolC family protein [Proteiniphilum]MDY9917455.1 TolC family protein [Proteiniphilum sp.]OJV85849.1 MAG: transporter [Bacteroidia bacterium 44-10]